MTNQPTYANFITAIQGMTVTGVNKHFKQPPTSIVAADLPVAFPLMPSGSLAERLVSCRDNNKIRSIGYVICIEAVGLDIQSIKYSKIGGLLDALETALDGLTIANFIDYSLTAVGGYEVAGNTYWAIMAEITARSA
jgi:hypothetical protein